MKEAAIEPVYKRKFICSVLREVVRYRCAPASPISSRAMRILHYHCTTRALIGAVFLPKKKPRR